MVQAVRLVDPKNKPAIGSILPNSWHPASDCDWVEVDTELDGACGFEIQHAGDSNSLLGALGFAGCQWPGKQLFALIEGYLGESFVPEDGGVSIREARVIGLFWWEV